MSFTTGAEQIVMAGLNGLFSNVGLSPFMSGLFYTWSV